MADVMTYTRGKNPNCRNGYKMGHNPSLETREKMRIARLHFKFSMETKKKISMSHLGVKKSKEHRENISKAKRGIKSSWWKGGESFFYLKTKEKIADRKRPSNCELCERRGTICFDHCHKTGKFRGWICTNCNFALGLVKDDVELLKKLIIYLNKNNGR